LPLGGLPWLVERDIGPPALLPVILSCPGRDLGDGLRIDNGEARYRTGEPLAQFLPDLG
jgi:hypothetical protein